MLWLHSETNVMTNEQLVKTAVENRYQGYRLIKTPISAVKLKAVKAMSSKIVTMDQVKSFAQGYAKKIGFSGDVEITLDAL